MSTQFNFFDPPPGPASPALIGRPVAPKPTQRRRKAYTIQAIELDPPGAARAEDPDTAKDAAAETRTRILEAIVMRAIASAPDGLTSEECAAATQLSLVTVSPRMRPLVRRGKIFDSKERRKNYSGKSAIVWKVMPF